MGTDPSISDTPPRCVRLDPDDFRRISEMFSESALLEASKHGWSDLYHFPPDGDDYIVISNSETQFLLERFNLPPPIKEAVRFLDEVGKREFTRYYYLGYYPLVPSPGQGPLRRGRDRVPSD